jgi:hypothetical protein
VPVELRLSAPAARRYVVGRAARREIHLLSPRLLSERASQLAESKDMLRLAPAACTPGSWSRRSTRGCAVRAGSGGRGWPPAPRSTSPAACATRGPRSAGACTRARRRRSRRRPATRCCSAARSSTCWPASRASRRRCRSCSTRGGAAAPVPRTRWSRRSTGARLRHTEGTWRAHLSTAGRPAGPLRPVGRAGVC